MQSYQAEPQMTDGLIHTTSMVPNPAYVSIAAAAEQAIAPTQFSSCFTDCMEMSADMETVAAYLDAHHEWFGRCAQPMTVEPIGQNSYALIIGRFGSFGFELEPKIGLDLLPQEEGIYRIQTVSVPGYAPTCYDVDFRATMELVDADPDEMLQKALQNQGQSGKVTKVQWQLDLTVTIHFPRFIHALPQSLIQSTGDRVLRQIVRQVSSRLTAKVQKDFHANQGVPMPKSNRSWFSRKSDNELELPDAC